MEDDSSDEDETKGTQGDIRYYVSEGGGMATSQVYIDGTVWSVAVN